MRLRLHLLPILGVSILALSVNLRLPAQQPTKATEKESDKQDQINKPSLETFRGRFRVGTIPGKEGPESIKLTFQDLANCRTYDVVLVPSGPKLEWNTDGFYAVVGKVVGGRIEATSSARVAEAASGQLSALRRKCDPAASTATPKPGRSAFIEVAGNTQAAKLVHRIEPTYPPIAKQAHIQGTVQFKAVIAKDGTVQELHTLSGNPILEEAAREAVKQWVYDPTLSNGKQVEVHTTIDVSFRLDQ